MKKWLGLVLGTLVTGFGAAGAEDGTVLHYRFSDAGDVVKDESPARNQGEKLAGTEACEGVDGKGIYCGGEQNGVRVPSSETLQSLPQLTVEAWISPAEAQRVRSIIYAADSADENRQATAPFELQWHGGSQGLAFNLHVTGEARRVFKAGCIEKLSFPQPLWYYVAGTYDGKTAILYVNGMEVGRTEWQESKPLLPVTQPLFIGRKYGPPWESFCGKIDEVRLANRALSAAEIKARYELKATFKPEPVAKAIAGTLDGKPYRAVGWQNPWLSCPLVPATRGTVEFSNTGEIRVQAGLGQMVNRLGQISIFPQRGLGERFYRSVDGAIVLTPPGQPKTLELRGETVDGVTVRQTVTVTPDNVVKFRYEFEKMPAGWQPMISYPGEIWTTALAFVGFQGTQRVKGRLIDLDTTVCFRDTLEVTQARGNTRMVLRLPPDIVYEVSGNRHPLRWIRCFSEFNGCLRKASPVPAGAPAVIEFSVQITDDATPPVLPPLDAVEITPEKPFDFTMLSESDPTKPSLKPVDREVPIFGIDEPVRLAVDHRDMGVTIKYPRYTFTVKDAYTGEQVVELQGKVTEPFWEWRGDISFQPPRAGAFLAQVDFIDAEGKIFDTAKTEIVVAGPIPQAEIKEGDELKLTLVDSADLSAADPKHDFYSCSDRTVVTQTPDGKPYRQTLSQEKMNALGLSIRDFIGVTLRLKNPKQDHIVEVVYADLDDSIMGVTVLEPAGTTGAAAQKTLMRVSSGVITGGVFKNDGKLKTFRTEYIPTGASPECAVLCSNMYYAPVGVAKINLYEVAGGLPRLPPMKHERLIGVHTEAGVRGVGNFGYGEQAGEYVPYPANDRYYTELYRATANLIRFMRFRGENVFIFGIYQYRNAMFPSKYVAPGVSRRDLDHAALVAKMFAYNDLKVVYHIACNNSLPLARQFRESRYDVIQGGKTLRQVASDGGMEAGHFGFQVTNPFHPDVQAEYRKLAEEVAERYGGYKSFAGVAWLHGALGLGEPCVFQGGLGIPADNPAYNDIFFKYSYDDETMRQFAAWAGITLPGKVGEADRFQRRYDYIMQNAKDKWIDFRCYATANFHKQMKEALLRYAPDSKYYVFDYYGHQLANELPASRTPLDFVRMCCSDPKYYKDVPGLVHCPYIPTLDGSQARVGAHGFMNSAWIPQIVRFAKDEEFAKAGDTGLECGKYLHRQFFETQVLDNPKRPWARFKDNPGGNYGTTTYPQPGERNWFADFVLLFRHSTPNFIAHMWCDGQIPFGHFDQMQAFVKAYRQLPLALYQTTQAGGGTYVRSAAPAFYVVETVGKPGVCIVAAAKLPGAYQDAVTGAPLSQDAAGNYVIPLQAYDLKVFLNKNK